MMQLELTYSTTTTELVVAHVGRFRVMFYGSHLQFSRVVAYLIISTDFIIAYVIALL